MRERHPAQPPLGANPFSGKSTGDAREFRRKRCAQCGRPFGLIRRQRGGRQFCSAQCLIEYTQGARAAPRSHWYDFIYQRR
jgi:hypothetical protein